jgi:hypothetical protein
MLCSKSKAGPQVGRMELFKVCARTSTLPRVGWSGAYVAFFAPYRNDECDKGPSIASFEAFHKFSRP